MNVGDKIQCKDMDELIELHDALCREGWDVEFEYVEGKKAVLYLKGREEE